MRQDNILLLTDVPPSKNYSGGILSLQISKFLEEEKYKLFCFCVMNCYLNPILDKTVLADIYLCHRPVENNILTDNDYIKFRIDIKIIVIECVRYIVKNNITKIICPIQGEVMTRIVDEVHEMINIPYIIQIWDPIEWWMYDSKFSKDRAQIVKRIYDNLIRNASSCITSSPYMTSYFKEEYSVDCYDISINSLDNEYDSIINENCFIIAISGQIYAYEETKKLLDTLELMNWEYKGKKIYFYYYGSWFNSCIDTSLYHSENIVIKGFYPQDELLIELSKVNILYCPYFFSEQSELKKVSELSFPSKLVSYLSVDTPILIHAPNYASPYKFVKQYDCGYLIDSISESEIKNELISILENYDNKYCYYINNVHIAKKYFSTLENRKKLFKAMNLVFSNLDILNILEVSNLDLLGRRWNGFDLQLYINKNTDWNCKQIVTYKTSNDENIYRYYDNDELLVLEQKLIEKEYTELSVHNVISLSSNMLKNHDAYKNSNLIHFHLIHNAKLSLMDLPDLMNNKPSIMTVHDPWIVTGRCVHFYECNGYESGCEKCLYLDTLFPLIYDNCNSLYNLKEKIFNNLNIDLVVSSPFMEKLVKASPIMKNVKNIHRIPFGVDLDKFNPNKITKLEAKKLFNIPLENYVVFFRAQSVLKGIEYIIEALTIIENDKKNITILTCDEKGLLAGFEEKYNIIEVGRLETDELVNAYISSDIFLMPSPGESFGVMAIEAMACERPVVIFDNTALPSVTFAPDCGVLVKNRDSKDLAKAIIWLLSDENERKRRGELGRRIAEENYDIKLYNKRMMDLYKDVYERKKNQKVYKSIFIEFEAIKNNLTNEELYLIYKLNIISNDVINKKVLDEYQDYKTEMRYEIDYSNDRIIAIVKEFNKRIYNLVKAENETPITWQL